MSDHQHAACKALATADAGAVEVLGASSDSTAPSFNTAQHKEKAMTAPTKSEKPLLAFIEAGGVNNTPVPAPSATVDEPDADQQMQIILAIATLKMAGYRVVKQRKPKTFKRGKDRVGPTFVCEFSDGTVARMTTFTPSDKLDWARGERLAQAAWRSRWRRQQRIYTPYPVVEPVPPAIVEAHFEEQNGTVLGRRPNREQSNA
jgi:hypothetical protein